MPQSPLPFPTETFEAISERFVERFGVACALHAGGKIVLDFGTGYDWSDEELLGLGLSHMIAESVRWGEPQITIDRDGTFVACVPVSVNNRVEGGLFAAIRRAADDERGTRFVHEAAWKLLDLAEEANVCNAALMRQNRSAARTDARRAEALHMKKQFKNPRDIYLIEEAKLLRAIRRKDLDLAREIINEVLLGVYHLGGRQFGLLKPLVLEMVVQMYRAAVEEGADPTELLGLNSGLLVDLLAVEDEYALNLWLTRWLEIFVNVDFGEKKSNLPRSLAPVILYVKKHLEKPLTRERVARACNLSPSYLSRLLKSSTGYAFSELLNRSRTDFACSLLEHTNLTASEVAFAAGFNDQSYFTRVFRRYQGMTPGRYRADHRA
jgi:AraC-like DNA-binding protein